MKTWLHLAILVGYDIYTFNLNNSFMLNVHLNLYFIQKNETCKLCLKYLMNLKNESLHVSHYIISLSVPFPFYPSFLLLLTNCWHHIALKKPIPKIIGSILTFHLQPLLVLLLYYRFIFKTIKAIIISRQRQTQQ